MIPGWWQFSLLALAAYRFTRLIGWDTMPFVVRLRARLIGWDGDQASRPLVWEFITCPFCFGFWVCAAFYISWVFAPAPTLYVAVPFALGAVVGLIAKNLDA